MREIKFQAFVDNDIIEGSKSAIYPVLAAEWNKQGDICKVKLEPCGWIDIKWVTLRDYTGLKDKNGVEIYEGDILKNYLGGTQRVVYDYGRYACPIIKHNSTHWPAQYLDCSYMQWEVIGNIYENPELLEALDEQDR